MGLPRRGITPPFALPLLGMKSKGEDLKRSLYMCHVVNPTRRRLSFRKLEINNYAF